MGSTRGDRAQTLGERLRHAGVDQLAIADARDAEGGEPLGRGRREGEDIDGHAELDVGGDLRSAVTAIG